MKYKIIEIWNMFKNKKRLAKKNADYQSRAVREIDLLKKLDEKNDLVINLQTQNRQLIEEKSFLEEKLNDYENREDYFDKALKECKSITTFRKKINDLKENEEI